MEQTKLVSMQIHSSRLLMRSVSALSFCLLSLCLSACMGGQVHAKQTSVRALPVPSAVRIEKQGARSYFVDSNGMTLYTFDRDMQPDKSACNDECAKAWPPLLSTQEETLPEDWTAFARANGQKQLAYRGKALYRFARDLKAGDRAGDGLYEVWHVSVAPDPLPEMPAGIRVETSAIGKIFADAAGKSLYFPVGKQPSCKAACVERYLPATAAALARNVGDWSIVKRSDGSLQWAYQNNPLYTYVDDESPGQVNGSNGREWRVALLDIEPRPDEVQLRLTLGGPVFVDRRGMTLYSVEIAGLLGLRSISNQPRAEICNAECAKIWRPLKAKKEMTVGAWSTVKRPDGSLQWSYEGKAAYTFRQDRKPGDASGDLSQLYAEDGRGFSWRVLRPM